MPQGDRDDSKWAWYWAEVDADKPYTNAWVVDPLGYVVQHISERVGETWARPPSADSPERRMFWEMAAWIPSKLRETLRAEFAAPRSKPYLERNVYQPTWSRRLARGAEMVGLIAHVYKRLESVEKGSGSLSYAVARTERPEALRAFIDTGSSVQAAKLCGCGQSALHKWYQKEAQVYPMLKAIMLIRARREGSITKDVIMSECFPEPTYFDEEFIIA